jgi:hypothetical protein
MREVWEAWRSFHDFLAKKRLAGASTGSAESDFNSLAGDKAKKKCWKS